MKAWIHSILGSPFVFEWQQRACNNYSGIRQHFRDFLDVQDKDILEVGCSTGTCGGSVVDMRANRYVGIDIEPQYIEWARKRRPAGNFQVMDARAMQFPDDSFDVVMFVGALHHMPDDVINACFQQIRRVLRPTGVVLCAEPLFTPGNPLSTFFLRNDRGQFIRPEAGYRALLGDLHIIRASHLRFSLHRFCSFVLAKQPLPQIKPILQSGHSRPLAS